MGFKYIIRSNWPPPDLDFGAQSNNTRICVSESAILNNHVVIEWHRHRTAKPSRHSPAHNEVSVSIHKALGVRVREWEWNSPRRRRNRKWKFRAVRQASHRRTGKYRAGVKRARGRVLCGFFRGARFIRFIYLFICAVRSWFVRAACLQRDLMWSEYGSVVNLNLVGCLGSTWDAEVRHLLIERCVSWLRCSNVNNRRRKCTYLSLLDPWGLSCRIFKYICLWSFRE